MNAPPAPTKEEALNLAKRKRLPYGKHYGKELASVPTPYLDWMAREWSEPRLAEAALIVLEDRLERKVDLESEAKKERAEKRRNSGPKDFTWQSCAFGELRTQLESAPRGLF